MENLQGFLLQRRACSPSSDGSERGGRTVIPISQHYLPAELSSWSGGKHCTVLGGRIRYLLCNLGRNSYNLLWQCECCIGKSCCAPWVTLIVQKGCPQKGVKKDKTEEDVSPTFSVPYIFAHILTYLPLCKAPRKSHVEVLGQWKASSSQTLEASGQCFTEEDRFPESVFRSPLCHHSLWQGRGWCIDRQKEDETAHPWGSLLQFPLKYVPSTFS